MGEILTRIGGVATLATAAELFAVAKNAVRARRAKRGVGVNAFALRTVVQDAWITVIAFV